MTVTPRADTQILEISYINVDPVIAQEVVESVTENFINYSTELIPNGNLKDYLIKNHPNDSEKDIIIKQLVDSIYFLHSNNI